MNRQRSLAAALAAILSAGAAQAAGPQPDRVVVRDQARPQPSAPAARAVQRFVVKTQAAAPTALPAALRGAVQRAGLARPLAATAGRAARPAASARVLRRMAAPAWHVVQTSRPLDASEAASFVRELSMQPGVQAVEIDQLYRPLDTARAPLVSPAAAPDDPAYGALQWNFHDAIGGVRAEQAWEISTGEGVVVAVIDTGIVADHADLAANVVPGYDMISDRLISRRDSDDRVPGGWDVGDWVEADYCTQLGTDPHPSKASSWHGSHVAGTIAQETGNGLGTAGLAHGAKVMPIRVLGACGGYGSDIADGILWAAGAEVEGLPINENPAEVINMSLGSVNPQACPQFYQEAIDTANGLGSIVVVAAGNDNANAGSYTMSSCEGVISVGATRINGGKANYSSWGPRVDIAAPGGGGDVDGDPNGYVFQVVNGGGTTPTEEWYIGGYAGTSMASPHVAAAVALVQSAVETPLAWDAMRDLLKQTARPFPVSIPGSTPIGVGILDAGELLRRATEPPCDPEIEDCLPRTTPLRNKTEVRGLSAGAGDALFSFEAEAGKPVSFMTFGGSGDVSMYVAVDRIPSAGDHDGFSARRGNTETVRFTAPVSGTYYILLSGSYTGLTLVARQ